MAGAGPCQLRGLFGGFSARQSPPGWVAGFAASAIWLCSRLPCPTGARCHSSVALPRTPSPMNSLELNKAFAAVLTAGITFMLAGQVGKILVHGERPHESAIKIGEVAAPAGAPAAAPAAARPAPPAGPEPIAGLLANASVENGQGIVQKQCAACHTLNQGGKAG